LVSCDAPEKKYDSIPVLKRGSVTANVTNNQKVEMLNSFFSTCFNSAFSPLSSSNIPSTTICEVSQHDDLLCTEEEIYGLRTLQKHLGQMEYQQECLGWLQTSLRPLYASFSISTSNWSSSTRMEAIYHCACSKNLSCMYTR